MAIEQKLAAVAPQLFTSDGGQYGVIKVGNATGFKVKQKVVIVAVGQETLQLQIKRIIGPDTITLGPFPTTQNTNTLTARTDLRQYTIAASAYIYAEEQDKPKLKPDDILQAVYDQEPTVAFRNVLVDRFGDYYGEGNPLPIAFDGTISVGNVTIQDDDGDELEINPDGSINVNVVIADTGNTVKSFYGEANAVPSGAETTIVQYMVPMLYSAASLFRISVSGENVGRYRVFLNDAVIDTRRTYYGGSFNEMFDFLTVPGEGLPLKPGDILAVKILHDRPQIGNFQGRIQVLEKP